jgi:uncharacterized protein DUF1877
MGSNRTNTIFMSIRANYYRLPPSERAKVLHDQKVWDEFYNRVEISRLKAMRVAIEKVKVDGLSREERFAKIGAAIESCRDPKLFNMEKDWHVIAYLLTGDAKITEAHLPDNPLHNVIFGGLKSSVTTGYGPARYFDSKLVAESAMALLGADRKVIAARYNPAEMKKLDLYAPTEESERKAVLNALEKFTGFFQKAASVHEDVITYAS